MNKHLKVDPVDLTDPDNPEWTEEDFERARPASEVLGPKLAAMLIRKPGRPPLAAAERKQQVTLRLSPDVLDFVKAAGPGWQTRIDDMLRKEMRRARKAG